MKIEAETIEEYFIGAGEREPELRELDAIIRKAAPNMKPVLAGGMTGKMLGYGMVPYKSTGKTNYTEWPVIALAVQKNYISLYVCAVIDGQYVAEARKDELGKVSVGKSCIRFKKLSDLDIETVKQIVKDLDLRLMRGEKLFGM